MSRLYPKRLRPKSYSIPKYVIGLVCPLCKQPILLVWQPWRDGSYRPMAIDPYQWKGQTIFLPGKHVAHSRHCDLQRRHFDTIKEVV